MLHSNLLASCRVPSFLHRFPQRLSRPTSEVNLMSLMKKEEGNWIFLYWMHPFNDCLCSCQFSCKWPYIDLIIQLKIKSWSWGWRRTAVWHQKKMFSCLILPFSWENLLSLNIIFTKNAAVIIGPIAADCLLPENIISISQKVPWRKHWKLNTIHPIIILFLENIYYQADSFWSRMNIAEQNWLNLLKKLGKHEIFI